MSVKSDKNISILFIKQNFTRESFILSIFTCSISMSSVNQDRSIDICNPPLRRYKPNLVAQFSPTRTQVPQHPRFLTSMACAAAEYCLMPLPFALFPYPCPFPVSLRQPPPPFVSGACLTDPWHVSNVSIIFYAPCLFLHHLPTVSLHFVALLCNFRN
jgi:hypothetical protein